LQQAIATTVFLSPQSPLEEDVKSVIEKVGVVAGKSDVMEGAFMFLMSL
jgi:ABC-type Fe3+-hydroxamate transport system substrate-binding protein